MRRDPPGTRAISVGRRRAGALEVTHDHCIQLGVARLDTGDRLIEQLHGGNVPCLKASPLRARCIEVHGDFLV